MAQQMLHRMPARTLLAFLVAALVLGTCSAHLDSKDMRQQMRTRIQGHQQFSELMRNAEAPAPQVRTMGRVAPVRRATPDACQGNPTLQHASISAQLMPRVPA